VLKTVIYIFFQDSLTNTKNLSEIESFCNIRVWGQVNLLFNFLEEEIK